MQIPVPEGVTDESASQFLVNPGRHCCLILSRICLCLLRTGVMWYACCRSITCQSRMVLEEGQRADRHACARHLPSG